MSYSNNSLKGYIVGFVRNRYPDYVSKREIDAYAASAGYIAENAGRRCRELVKDGRLETKLELSKNGIRFAVYRWVKPPPPKTGEERVKELAQLNIF